MNQSAWFRALYVACLLAATVRSSFAEGSDIPLSRINTAIESWKKDGQLAPLLPELIASRNSKDERVRSAANDALATIGPDVSAVMTWVIEQAKRPNNWNPNTEKQVADALGKFGLEAVPAILQAAAVDHAALRTQRVVNPGGSFGAGQRLQKVFAVALSKLDDSALPTLLAMLGDQTHAVRAIAADTLRLWGVRAKPALPQLLAAVDDRDGEVRLQALGAVLTLAITEPPAIDTLCAVIRDHRDVRLRQDAIVRLQVPANKPLLTAAVLLAARDALADPQSQVRLGAAGLLLDRPEHRDLAERVLSRDCGARDAAVRQQALTILRQSTGADKAFARSIAVRMLADEGYQVRNLALEVLRSAGVDAESKPRLLEVLSDEEPQVRSTAASILWDMGEPVVAVKYWLSQMKTPGTSEFSHAQSRLQQVRPIPSEVEPLLVEALGSTQVEVRRVVLQVLMQRTTLSDTSLAAIQKLTKDADSSVRSQALQLLRNRNVSKDARLKLLTEGLADADANVRQQAVSQLLELGTVAKPVLPRLLELLKDPKEPASVRQVILGALPGLGVPRETLIPEMVALFKDIDPQIASRAVGVLGTQGPQAVPHLLPLLDHKESAMRTAASRALSPLVAQNPGMAPKVIPGLLAQYAAATETDRTAISGLLRQIGAGSVKILTPELSSPQLERRRLAAETLRSVGSTGAQSAEKELIAALNDDDLRVRLNAAVALVAFGSRTSVESSPRVLAALLEGAKSNDADVRLIAAQVGPAERIVNADFLAAMKNIVQDKDQEAVLGAVRYLVAHREFDAVKPALPKLIDTIGSRTPASNTVFNLIISLRPIAKDVAPLLAERLKKVGPAEESQVFFAFGALGPDMLPTLKATWTESDTRRQTMILTAMRNLGPIAVPTIIELLEKADPIVASSNLSGLGTYASQSPAALKFLMTKLNDPDLKVSSAAASSLGSAGRLPETVVPALLRVLRAVLASNEPNPGNEQTSILWALARTGEHARPALGTIAELMHDKRPGKSFLRSNAAAVIVEIDPGYPGVAAVLVECANEAGAVGAAQALVKLGPRARSVLPKMEALLPDSTGYLRGQLVYALALCESESPLLIEALGEQLENTRGNPQYAIQAVKVLGPRAKSLTPKLLEMLDQTNVARQEVIAALSRASRDAPELVERLGKLLETDRNVRVMTLLALADQGERAKPVEAAVEAVWSGDPSHRTLAAAVLVLMKADAKSRASTTLLAVLEPDWGGIPQLALADALAVLGAESDDVRKNLQATLKHQNNNVRVCAARALWKIDKKPDEVLPILLDGVKQAGLNSFMHIECARTLTEIGPPGKAAAPDLIRLANAANGDQQVLYVKALKSIHPAAAAEAGF